MLLIGAALMVFGHERVANRLNDISSGSLEQLDQGHGRRAIWETTVRAIPDHVIAGSGVGSFQEVYPSYADVRRNAGSITTHSENCYLQIPLETGGFGFVLVLVGIVSCACWCFTGFSAASPDRLRLCAGAVAASFTAFAVHGAVDFVWYVPACSAMIAVLAGCALRVCQLSRRPACVRVHLSQWMPVAAVAGLLVMGGWMFVDCLGPALAAPYWDQYLIALNSMNAENTANSSASTPDGGQLGRVQEMTACLEQVVQNQPSHFLAQLALAELHMQYFEAIQASSVNPMSLGNVRDAVVQSNFATREAMVEWLSRAVGDHWVHLERALVCTRQAIALCPLQGRAYLYLADLGFLEGRRGPSKQDCVSQALQVRPFDGMVLYAAGNAAYLAGDVARWLDYMRQVFHCGPIYQRRLISDLIGHTATEGIPSMVDFIVREFEPNLDGMRFLYGMCAERCRPEELPSICRAWAEKAKEEARVAKDAQAAYLWLEAFRLHTRLQEPLQATECVSNALKSDPNNFGAHYEYAMCLIKQELFADAESHLRWCLQRSPGNAGVAAGLKQALRGRLDVERRTAVLLENRR
jgi:tetratricopeptide (TPR) repeat protein